MTARKRPRQVFLTRPACPHCGSIDTCLLRYTKHCDLQKRYCEGCGEGFDQAPAFYEVVPDGEPSRFISMLPLTR